MDFFKSVWFINLKEESSIPINIIVKIIKFELLLKIKKNLFKVIIAILTRIPLKKIEKLVFTSTCVLVIQKENGHTGIFIPIPIKSKTCKAVLYLKFLRKKKL